jgi:hypothetical protein
LGQHRGLVGFWRGDCLLQHGLGPGELSLASTAKCPQIRVERTQYRGERAFGRVVPAASVVTRDDVSLSPREPSQRGSRERAVMWERLCTLPHQY